MKRKLYYIQAALVSLLLLSSCGDFFDYANNPVTAGSMKLSRKVIALLVGEHYAIPVNFEPAELSNNAVFWLSDDDEIVDFVNDTLVARSQGQTTIYAFSTIDCLRDTAIVVVLPEMYIAPSTYPYDMSIYASVTIHGTTLNPNYVNEFTIAAYVGDELRGIGVLKHDRGVYYMEMRVWSPLESGEEVFFLCYFHGQARAELFPNRLIFDGGRHGSLSDLYQMVLDDNAEEYVPNVSNEETIPIIDVPDTTEVDIYH